MLLKELIDKKIIEVILTAFLAYYFGSIFSPSIYLTASFFVLLGVMFFYITKIEYFFYILLASRSIVDIFIGTSISGDVKMAQFLAVLVIFLFLIYFMIISNYNIIKMMNLGVNKIYGIFLILSLFAIVLSPSIMGGMRSWFRFVQIFVIINMTIFVVLSGGYETYKKRINIICWSALVSLIVPLTMFFNNIIQGKSIDVGGAARYVDFGAHVNVFSYSLLAIFPFCLFLYTVTIKNVGKIFGIILIALFFYSIYMTQTRNIWIGLVVLIFSWSVFRKNIIMIGLFVGLALLVVSYNSDFLKRFDQLGLIIKTEGGFFDMDGRLLSGRIGLWQNHLKYFIENSTLIEKFIGSGFGISEKVAALYGDLWHSRAMGEHNNYLTLLMATGIFGLLLYLFFIISLFQESIKLLKKTQDAYLINLSQVFLSVLVSYLVVSGFTHMMWHTTYQMFFSVFAGLIIAANIIVQNQQGKDENRSLVIEDKNEA